MYTINHRIPLLSAIVPPPKKIRKDLYIPNEKKALSIQNYYYSSFTTLRGLTKLYGNNLIGNSFIRKFVKNSYASQKNKSDKNAAPYRLLDNGYR